MSAEWVTAVASLLTFVVIAGSAVAAIVQLRHMRSSNQIAALTEIRETYESPEFQTAALYVMGDLQNLYVHPSAREQMMCAALPADFHRVRIVANLFESVGAFVRYGLLDRNMTCDIWGYVVIRHWNALAPFIKNRRRRMDNPALFENFEYLAALSKRWAAAHGPGNYPSTLPRMPDVTMWDESQPE
jgi:hypothetical protein